MDISHYGLAFDAAMSANRELKRNKAKTEDWFRSMGVLEYCKQLNTIHLDFGRQTGKTSFAASLVLADPDSRLLITHCYQMQDHILREFRVKSTSVATPDNRARLVKLSPPSLVIIDEPGFFSNRVLDDIYKTLGSQDTMFLILGRGRK